MQMKPSEFRKLAREMREDQVKVTRGRRKKGEEGVFKPRDESLELTFETLWKWAGGGEFEWKRNYVFDPDTDGMEMDFALPHLRIGVEINGGQALGGKSGHGNWYGLERDAIKINRTHILDWRLWILTTSMVTIDWARIILNFVKEAQEQADGTQASREGK